MSSSIAEHVLYGNSMGDIQWTDHMFGTEQTNVPSKRRRRSLVMDSDSDTDEEESVTPVSPATLTWPPRTANYPIAAFSTLLVNTTAQPVAVLPSTALASG